MERQRTRGRLREEREFDQTQLRANHYGYIVHRDYAAHFFRWGWISRQIKHGSKILDIGCGQDVALARVLAARLGGNRETYVGVDLNKIKLSTWKWARIYDECNVLVDWKMIYDTHGLFDHVVCCEVIEHMDVDAGQKLLTVLRKLVKPDGWIWLSTPVFNGQAAANHIHEYTIDELDRAIRKARCEVVKRYGTFANVRTIYDELMPYEERVWDRLAAYYGNDVMSMVFAPLYPDASRNILWKLRRKGA